MRAVYLPARPTKPVAAVLTGYSKVIQNPRMAVTTTIGAMSETTPSTPSTASSDPATEPVTGPIPPVAPPPQGQPVYAAERPRRSAKVPLIAAWVGIVAGVVFIVAVIFGTGFMLGAHSGGHGGGHGRGDVMMHRGGPPQSFPMGPMVRPGPGFVFPGGPGGSFGPFGPGGAGTPGGIGPVTGSVAGSEAVVDALDGVVSLMAPMVVAAAMRCF